MSYFTTDWLEEGSECFELRSRLEKEGASEEIKTVSSPAVWLK